MAGRRDKALLLAGFAGGLRRSELVALDVEDVRYTKDGMVLRIRSSKADQEGEGADVGISHGSHLDSCPVRAIEPVMHHARQKNIDTTRGYRQRLKVV